ncbi:hypothetical protein WJT74_10215 [Sphingomicrobium sp. XHP0239]|uniref:hypothetical protein n=1 Tax=Sphingomicrobium maritimum TaxID=3133972 RepID=UPI0031CCBB7F
MKFLIALPALALTGASPPASDNATEDRAEPITTTRTANPPVVVRDLPRVDFDGRVTSEDRCDDLARTARRELDRGAPLPPMRKLDELPPAEGYYAVWRTDAYGCPDPAKFTDD